jgi:hypothetical protein
MVKEEQCYVESVGGVDEDTPSTFYVHMLSTSVHTPTSSILDVESVKCQMMIFHNLPL